MLIKCPECDREISDKSKQCIHCGYPIFEENNKCVLRNKQYDLSEELQMVLNNMGTPNVIRSLRMKCGLSLTDAKKLYDIINETKKIPECFECEVINLSSINIPRCPYCQSTNVKKISMTNRMISVSLLGLASNKINKQWHCNNCKSDF